MEHKTIQFEVLPSNNPCCWKWVVFMSATKTRTGIALTRADAVLDAEIIIEKVLRNKGSETKCREKVELSNPSDVGVHRIKRVGREE